MGTFQDLSDTKVGLKFVIGLSGNKRGKEKVPLWLVRCDCGREYETTTQQIKAYPRCGACRQNTFRTANGKNEKFCPSCDKWLDISVFTPNGTGKNRGVSTYCQKCDSIKGYEKKLRYSYGVKLSEREVLLAKQGNRCAICGCLEVGRRLCLDHDHKTGKVRGLLCNTCNHSLSKLEQVVDWDIRARNYLDFPMVSEATS